MEFLASLDVSPVLGGVVQDVTVVACRVVFFLSAVLLMVIILLQEGKGGGLASALGGQGAETFGVATGGVNKVTLWLAGIFLLAALGHTMAYKSTVQILRDENRGKPGGAEKLPPIDDLFPPEDGGDGEEKKEVPPRVPEAPKAPETPK